MMPAQAAQHQVDSHTEQAAPEEGYRRGLSARQIQMVAIGGAIGVGLFCGSGTGIARIGPSLIACYAAAGVVAANLISVTLFGELEFWFATIKVVAIIAMIIIGVGVLTFGFSALASLMFVVVMMALSSDTRLGLYVWAVWFIAHTIGYRATRRRHAQSALTEQ